MLTPPSHAATRALALAMAVAACGGDSSPPAAARQRAARTARMPAPDVRQIGEGKTWRLLAPVVYRAGTGDSLVIPTGFVAEFAGVPRWFHPYLVPAESHAAPAIVQDYLYWSQRCTREEADGVFRRAMEEQGVADSTVGQLYDAAVAWGGTAWRTYERDRAAGMPRIVPATARADGSLETWAAYRTYLRDSARVPEPPVVASATLCALGRP